ncbi:MAG TPA: DNA polymerase III subunit alpha [Gemmatimonadales bacterium]|jgi:DNA polymerase-3 subunit alpha|nr:DNA polymerase III subunit alpha [Gemmatimonadales bacterium]
MAFVHLHTHSEYSLLDGANRIPELVAHVQALGMDSLAVTDHGNLHCAWTFYEEARARGLRPILGFEAYLAFGPRTSMQKPPGAPAAYSHLVLLARNRIGYRNLVRLSSIGYLEGFYRRPRIDREVLAQYAEGLVGLAACLSGEIALWLRQGNYEEARRSAEWFARTFGEGNFWLEVQQHGIPDETRVNEGMFRLARELGLGVVATNDAHYLRREDAEAHDLLLAIGTGAELDDPKRFRFTGSESYVKSEAEMAALFRDHPEVLANTQVVADRCEFSFEKQYFVPEFPRPAGYRTDEALLEDLARQGAEARYGTPLPGPVAERLAYELSVIVRAGYAGYFLIVQDFIAAARARGIPVGPGRGSAAGSLVAYALGITNVDPLRFDLLFERFLNPERVSMPDIDVDFCFERRSEVIEYVRERYGRNSVGQIITFGTLKARAAVKDVARLLRIPPGEADRLTKLIPSGPAFQLSIPDALEKVTEFRELVEGSPQYQQCVRLASRIEGISRHASVHAAGVVIAPGPLHEYVPVCTAPTKGAGAGGEGEDAIITQYEMGPLEKVGMLKMDLLGLKTLTVIHDAVRTIAERHGTVVDVDRLDLEDPRVYQLLRQGRTAGVFQFESPLATETLRNMKCDRFDDLVASNALLRPGPLDAGMHLVFIRRKLGLEKVTYPHPLLEEVLRPTYGVITYQEQVMRIANILAGYSLAEADVLRKAVGKKDQELIDREVGRFIERAVANGVSPRLAEELGSQIKTFGRYGFNKSHSVAYSLLSYQTAWLKTYYPAEFMAALLSSEIGNTDKVVQYINEARELGLEVLPPDVNESGFKFTVTADRRIRFGLGAVRNVGRGAIESIIAARAAGRFTSLADFVQRVDLRLCNKRVLESLIAAGALDSLAGHRAQLAAALDEVLREAQVLQQEREAGQASLFGDAAPASRPRGDTLPDVPPWSEAERLAREKEVLGFFISGHPLERFRAEVEVFGTRTTATLGQWSEHQVTVAAVVTQVRRQISKKTGKEYARLVIEDFHGTAEAIVFPESWARLNQVVREDLAMLLTGGYSPRDRDEERAPFVVESARPLEELKLTGALGLAVRWKLPEAPTPEQLRQAAALLSAHPGPVPVYIEWSDGNGERLRARSRRIRVTLDDDLLRELRRLLGPERVGFVRAGPTPGRE